MNKEGSGEKRGMTYKEMEAFTKLAKTLLQMSNVIAGLSSRLDSAEEEVKRINRVIAPKEVE